jgi:hypothetical protein
VGNDRKLRAGITTAARIPHDDRGVHARRAAGAPDDGHGRACDVIGAWRSHDGRRDRALVVFSALDVVRPPATAAEMDAIPPLYALVGVTRCSECDSCRRWLKDDRHDYCLQGDAVTLDCTRCRAAYFPPENVGDEPLHNTEYVGKRACANHRCTARDAVRKTARADKRRRLAQGTNDSRKAAHADEDDGDDDDGDDDGVDDSEPESIPRRTYERARQAAAATRTAPQAAAVAPQPQPLTRAPQPARASALATPIRPSSPTRIAPSRRPATAS